MSLFVIPGPDPPAFDFASGPPDVSTLSCAEQRVVLRRYKQWKADMAFSTAEPSQEPIAGCSTSALSKTPTHRARVPMAAMSEMPRTPPNAMARRTSDRRITRKGMGRCRAPAVSDHMTDYLTDLPVELPATECRFETKGVGLYPAPPDHMDHFLTDDPVQLSETRTVIYPHELSTISFGEDPAANAAREEQARLVAEARAELVGEMKRAARAAAMPPASEGIPLTGNGSLSGEEPFARPVTIGLSRSSRVAAEREWRRREMERQGNEPPPRREVELAQEARGRELARRVDGLVQSEARLQSFRHLTV